MAVYMISYDLHKIKKYKELIEAIEDLGDTFQLLESQYLVSTTRLDAQQIRNSLRNYMDEDDEIFINRLDHHWSAMLRNADELTYWIKGKIDMR